MADKGEYRGIYVSLIDSYEFQQLSAAARAVLFTLKLKLGQAGIGPFPRETLPRYTGHTAGECEAAWLELVGAEWVQEERNIVWLRNGLRFDPSEPLSSPNQRKGIERHVRSLAKLDIVAAFVRYYELPPLEWMQGGPRLVASLEGGKVSDSATLETIPEGFGNPFEARKTEDGRRKTETDTTTTDTRAVVTQAMEDAANDIIRAANRGQGGNPLLRSSALPPILLQHGSRSDVIQWLLDGIPAALCVQTVEAVAKSYEPAGRNKCIVSMKYFDGPVRDAHEAAASGGGESSLAATGTDGPAVRRGAWSRNQQRRPMDQQAYTPTDDFEGFNG